MQSIISPINELARAWLDLAFAIFWQAMDSGSALALSAFWKARMGRLTALARAPVPSSSPRVVILCCLAAILCTIPTLRGAASPNADDASTDKKALRVGRIYINATLKVPDPESPEPKRMSGIFSIDPETGEWKHLVGYGHGVRVSPDGETLIFTHNEETWNCDSKEAAGPGRLVGLGGKLSWTDDGKHFVASSGKYVEEKGKEGWECKTWKVSYDGLTRVELPIPPTDFVEDWSPAGNLVVTSTDRHPPKGSGYQLYIMRPDGTGEQRLTKNGLNVYARFSPDGKQIAYLHQRGGNSLRIINSDGTNDRTILQENGYSNSTGAAAWSPDGKRLVVTRFDWQTNPENGERSISDPADAKHRIEIMDADGSNSRPLELKNATIIWLGHPDWH